MKKLVLLFLLLCFSLPGQEGNRVYVAPSPEPTDEETLCLQLMNRFRADPKKEYELIVAAGNHLRGVNAGMFKKEMLALSSSPPMVFNLELLKAARRHSHYMIINNKLGHDETPGKPGFTGKRPSDRTRAAGYQRGGATENAYLSPRSVLSSHYGFIVDRGPGGTGGMQPGRGHRRNMMSSRTDEVGCGGIWHSDKRRWSVIHNMGRSGSKLVGGVIYMDYNGNKFYDPGEGLGDVEIKCKTGDKVKTWKSGAYRLTLSNQKKTEITATFSGLTVTGTIEAGYGAQQFNVDFKKVFDDKIKGLISDIEKIEDKTSPQYFQKQINLHLAAFGLKIDASLRKKVKALTAEAGLGLRASQAMMFITLNKVKTMDDLGKFKNLWRKHRGPYAKTPAENWYKNLEKVSRYTRKIAAFEKTSLEKNRKSKTYQKTTQILVDKLKKLKAEIVFQDLEALIQKYIQRVMDCSKV
jgi:hypothetical protein